MEDYPAPSERIRSIIRKCNEIACEIFIDEHKDADEFGYIHLEVTPEEFREFKDTCPPAYLFHSPRYDFEHFMLCGSVIMKPSSEEKQ